MPAEAEKIYRKILEVAPGHPDANHLMGLIERQAGRDEQAVEWFSRAIQANPDVAAYHGNLGNAFRGLERLDEAVGSYEKALSIHPDFAEAHSNLGSALKELGRLDEAVDSFHKALAINSQFAKAHSNLGNALQELGLLDEAVDSYYKALAIQPDNAEVHNNLGNALQELRRLDEAMASYDKALAIQPEYAEALNNLGLLLQDLGRLDEAVDSYHKAIAIKPNFVEPLINLGGALKELGRLDEALDCHRRAVETAPDNAEAHHHLSLHLLLTGEMREGWDEYEWRWRIKSGAPWRSFPQTLWQGEDLGGKSILVWCEQGVGDEILFSGMIPALTDAGAQVILESDPRLVNVFARSFPDITCVGRGAAPDFQPVDARLLDHGIDFQIAAGSLGRWLRLSVDSRPGPGPDPIAYLDADGARRNTLREQYKAGQDALLVGVSWNSKNKRIGENKSLPLAELAPLAGLPGIVLVDLQYGDTQAERQVFAAQTGTDILHDDNIDQMADLDAFAAQVAAMDLVVTVSNTTAHFSGALGVPTWVLVHHAPLPCWMLNRDDSPWYPSVTLFRRSLGGEWTDVIKHVVNRLRDFHGNYS